MGSQDKQRLLTSTALSEPAGTFKLIVLSLVTYMSDSLGTPHTQSLNITCLFVSACMITCHCSQLAADCLIDFLNCNDSIYDLASQQLINLDRCYIYSLSIRVTSQSNNYKYNNINSILFQTSQLSHRCRAIWKCLLDHNHARIRNCLRDPSRRKAI